MATPRDLPARKRRAARGGSARTGAARGAAGAAAAPQAPTPGAAAATRDEPAPRAALEAVRERIDGVDAEIHRLLNERARLAQQVGISKSHALVQQPVDLLIDHIDALAHRLERRPRRWLFPRRRGRARSATTRGAALAGQRVPRSGHVPQRMRADSTPSMARSSASSASPSAPSASMSV